MVGTVVNCGTRAPPEGRLPLAPQKHSPRLGNILLPNVGHPHRGVYVCKNSLSHTLTMCRLYVFIPQEINLEIKVFKVFKKCGLSAIQVLTSQKQLKSQIFILKSTLIFKWGTLYKCVFVVFLKIPGKCRPSFATKPPHWVSRPTLSRPDQHFGRQDKRPRISPRISQRKLTVPNPPLAGSLWHRCHAFLSLWPEGAGCFPPRSVKCRS